MIKSVFNFFFSPIYKSIVNLFEINYHTDDLIRLGKSNDGGYVVLRSSLSQYSNLISFGIAGDVSFEKQFQNLSGCKISCFDPSIDKLPEPLESTTFFKLGIDSKNSGEYISLTKAVELSNIPPMSKLFLKMDIEGYEWNIFSDKESFDTLINFDQIIVELHMKYLLGKSKYFMPIELVKRLFILKRLRKFFYIYNTNANNVCGYMYFRNFIFPEVIEISFVNKHYSKRKLVEINQPSDPSILNIQEFIKK